jgi:hypothetical protein
MRTFVAAFLFVVFPLSAAAQPDGAAGMWKHRFQEKGRTVYLDIRPKILNVWSINDRGNCTMMPRSVRWDGKTVGRWSVTIRESEMDVTFPDTTITYQKTPEAPERLCSTSET